MAQLANRSIPKQEVCRSNLVVGKILLLVVEDKNKEKGSGTELGDEHLYLPYSLTCHAYAA